MRHLLDRRSEAGFRAEVARDWGHLFPRRPRRSEACRRTRWLWGAFEQFRATLVARLPEDDCQQADTSKLAVRHPSRGRSSDHWTRPGNGLAARFGGDAAHAEWFYGFRLATELTWAAGSSPAALSERAAAADLLEVGPAPRHLLADKGFNGRAFAASRPPAALPLGPPGKIQRAAIPSIPLKVIAEWRNRIETTFSEITDRMEWPATAPILFGVFSPGPRRPSPPTSCCSPASPRRNPIHITRIRRRSPAGRQGRRSTSRTAPDDGEGIYDMGLDL